MVLCAEFQQDAKFLKKVFGDLKKITYLCSPFRKCLARGRGKKIFKKDLVDSKITLIFAIPFATKMRSFFKLVL